MHLVNVSENWPRTEGYCHRALEADKLREIRVDFGNLENLKISTHLGVPSMEPYCETK